MSEKGILLLWIFAFYIDISAAGAAIDDHDHLESRTDIEVHKVHSGAWPPTKFYQVPAKLNFEVLNPVDGKEIAGHPASGD